MASIKDVARRADVSVGTVSNVLNRASSVSPRYRERVERAISELGFVRNDAARQLRAGSSRTIAVVVLDVANPFFTDVVAGAERAAEAHDALVIVCNSGSDPAREGRHLARLVEQRVMGLLLTPVAADDRNAALERLQQGGTPVVLVDRVSPRDGVSSVAVDDVRGGRLAVGHLLDRGHRRLAFVGGPLSLRQVAERLTGAQASLDPTGTLRVVETAEMSVRAGAGAVTQLLADDGTGAPTAVFCANDLLALGVLNECLRRGVQVPHDLAVVGYDDIDFASTATVPLTSVSQPRDLLGHTAVELLLDRIAGLPARQVQFDPELVVRASTVRAPRRRAGSDPRRRTSPGRGAPPA